MDEFDGFDPALFSTWVERPLYGDECGAGEARENAALRRQVRAVLEVKSADGLVSAGEELRRLLNEMTLEMRAQFATFRQMRESAAEALVDGDEAQQKLARADVKAATDAMSLIVRTLEKIDSLQRQLARDREIEAEHASDAGGYEEAKARFVAMIEEKANAQALALFEAWKHHGPPDGIVALDGHALAEHEDAASGPGEAGAQDENGLR